ncbi:Alkaline ceramidase 3 [Perkinsus chesapeaki]|uniref:Alkaline ceramidase 3 n=1 Tax=Perkinsus chesapeaki TaxID=330153 RepID=A0A7J6MU80_PERCH|nr:Alkaline ceramidase 3 [Perkinsus chesapeaki]
MLNITADVPGNSTSFLQRGSFAETFFGPPASMDFCEDNYAYTDHIVEFANTLTSIFIVVIGVVGMLICAPRAGNEHRYRVYYVIMIFIGLGSTLFHGTLRRLGQAMDEIPMLWMSLTSFWIILFYNAPKRDTKAHRWAWVFTSLAIGLTAVYLSTWKMYLIFVATYTSATAVGTCLVLYRCYSHRGPSRVIAWRFLEVGLAVYLTATVMWTLDYLFCDYLKPFYLHAIVWHTFSVTGAHLSLQAMVALRSDALNVGSHTEMFCKVLPMVGYNSVRGRLSTPSSDPSKQD